MAAVLTADATDFVGMKGARGFVDDIDYASNQLAGWVLRADVEFDSVRVYLNGALAGSGPILARPDVAQAHPWIPHAARAGFRVQVRPGLLQRTGVNRACVVGCRDGEPVARLADVFRKDREIEVPVPPPELMARVQGSPSPELFRSSGYRFYVQFLDVLARHCEVHSLRHLLDWGCGCGRLVPYFLAGLPGLRVDGCDIDAEAVAWCAAHIPGAHFAAITRQPELPYPDGAFDVAIAMGVFMALGHEFQQAWLPELRRVIALNGLFVASVQSELSIPFTYPPETAEQLQRDGIAGSWERHPGIFQTQDYTYREWSKYFEILEYVETGLNGHHDLVVLRRSA